MEKEVKVLFVSKYDSFTNNDTGEIVDGGTKINFIDKDPVNSDNWDGFAVTTFRLPLDRFKELKSITKPFKAMAKYEIVKDRVRYTDIRAI